MTRRLLHTPGPWSADDGDGQYFGIFGLNGEPLAYLAETSSTHDQPLPGQWVTHPGGEWECRLAEHAANAHLIAAAPDLFDGCNALLGLIQLVCARDDMPPEIREALETSHRREEARIAVAKARGLL
jgi:hypothetical protein